MINEKKLDDNDYYIDMTKVQPVGPASVYEPFFNSVEV
jgi:hypothetical protein